MAKQGEAQARLLKTKRGFFKTLIFTILTLGIYPCYLIGAAKRELNLVCKDDGKRTAGFWKVLFLSIITIGIYGVIWQLSACNRTHKYLKKHGKRSRISGAGYFFTCLLGLILGAGAGAGLYFYVWKQTIVNPYILYGVVGGIFLLACIIAFTKFLHNWNDVNKTYNEMLVAPAPQPQGQTVNLGGQTLTFYTSQVGGVPATQNQQVCQPVAYNYAPNAGKCRVIDAYQESERLYQVINQKNKASGFDSFQAILLILAFIFVVLLIAIVVIAAINPALISQFLGLFKKAAVVVPKVIAKVSQVGIWG